jgi:hypothetical protein
MINLISVGIIFLWSVFCIKLIWFKGDCSLNDKFYDCLKSGNVVWYKTGIYKLKSKHHVLKIKEG